MRKGFILPVILFFCIVILSAFTVVNTVGIQWATGSPFDGTTCNFCHGGGATTPTITVNSTPAFGSGNIYAPGTTYTLDVIVAGSYVQFGFNLEILNSTAHFGAVDAGVFGSLLTTNERKFTVSGKPTTISHNGPSGSAGSAIFSFEWTAPNSGDAYLYCAGLGVNLNGNEAGDKVTNYSVTLSSPLGIESLSGNTAALTIFPNPANNNVQLSYNLNETSKISGKLFNLNGELVCDLFSEVQNPGKQSAAVRLPFGLDKGMYMIKLFINEKQTIEKLMVY